MAITLCDQSYILFNAGSEMDLPFSLTPTDTCDTDIGQANARASFDSFNKTLQSVIPLAQNRNKNFSNPCWYAPMEFSNSTTHHLVWSKSLTDEQASLLLSQVFGHRTKTLFCIPKVYLIGFPKSGSTTLYNLIVQHPLVTGGDHKEPHWWTRFPYINKFPQNVLAFLQYLAQYRDASRYIQRHPEALAIDGSQSTIWDTQRSSNLCDIPSLISRLVPNGKYIVIMRDPVARLYSDFVFLCRPSWGKVPQAYFDNVPVTFHKEALEKIGDFNECMETSNIDICTHYMLSGNYSRRVPTFGPGGCGQVRLGISLYQVHVARWLQVIPKEQFLFLRTEDLANDPYSMMRDVWDFLGLPEQTKEALGSTLYEHSKLNPLSRKKAVQMKTATCARLREFYQPFNEKLAKLVENDKFLWTDTSA